MTTLCPKCRQPIDPGRTNLKVCSACGSALPLGIITRHWGLAILFREEAAAAERQRAGKSLNRRQRLIAALRRLEPGEAERLAVALPPRSMTRWRATIIHVRNPTNFEYRLMRGADWLNGHGWAPSALRKWRDGFSGGQTSTDWIVAPATNKTL